MVQPGRQITEQVTVTTSNGDDRREITIPYLLFVPEGYDQPERRWPLMLFLHGLGESGDGDMKLVKKHGPPKIVEKRRDFPFIVVSPQCPRPQNGDFREAWQAEQLMKLIEHVAESLRVDDSRIYVTGLSMGGYGTWRLAAAYPDRFAAAAPICGGGDPATAPQLRKLPIWCFHGAGDDAVPLSQSQQMVDAVKKAGGNVKLTVYPDAGHDSWTETYTSVQLYDWLLSHRRAEPE